VPGPWGGLGGMQSCREAPDRGSLSVESRLLAASLASYRLCDVPSRGKKGETPAMLTGTGCSEGWSWPKSWSEVGRVKDCLSHLGKCLPSPGSAVAAAR
jgi:hypothetical protein